MSLGQTQVLHFARVSSSPYCIKSASPVIWLSTWDLKSLSQQSSSSYTYPGLQHNVSFRVSVSPSLSGSTDIRVKSLYKTMTPSQTLRKRSREGGSLVASLELLYLLHPSKLMLFSQEIQQVKLTRRGKQRTAQIFIKMQFWLLLVCILMHITLNLKQLSSPHLSWGRR